MHKNKLFQRAKLHSNEKIAIEDNDGKYTYKELEQKSNSIAKKLLKLENKSDLKEKRIVFVTNKDFLYPAIQWGIWKAGGISVPLSKKNNKNDHLEKIKDSQAYCLITPKDLKQKFGYLTQETNLKEIIAKKKIKKNRKIKLPQIQKERRAQILYTSGTTGQSKGVITTHKNITAQITSLIEAWNWSKKDKILNTLPLNHAHGVINILSCALWSGATCKMMKGFEPEKVWKTFINDKLTLFMGVPTMYHQLLKEYKQSEKEIQNKMRSSCNKFRLMVSGSAPLSPSLFKKWKETTGIELLERYGTTETLMILSNPIDQERKPGYVGKPLPGVKVKLANIRGQKRRENKGEIRVKGDNVFTEYWNKPKATKGAFDENGWYKTGDIAKKEDGYYKILGRKKENFINSGGYKVSTLEVEQKLEDISEILRAKVVGVDDEKWGKKICAAVVTKDSIKKRKIKSELNKQLSFYKIPKKINFFEKLPKNQMGKVDTEKLKSRF
jgi:malonyl-CoA/methylmalonyl-CoA synthetase